MKTAVAIARAISDREQRNATLKALRNRLAKFESRAGTDHERRRVREAVRKHRTVTRAASAAKPGAAKPSAAKLCRKKARTAKPDAKTSRHLPCNCCGRRKAKCTCFTKSRGLEIASSFKRKVFRPIPAQVQKSRIQTWRDTGDMPAYMRQIGWTPTMRYSWLFPIAFVWRHFSNEQFWAALQNIGAVLQNQPPDFARMEKVMRAFEAKGVSYHGGIFFSGSSLTKYCYGNAGKLAKLITCTANQDFITREILALKVMWHVASNMKRDYDSLQRNPTRQCWKVCTEKFLAALQAHTRGIFAHYSLKICLDGVLLSQPCLEALVSWWPMMCPAYENELPKLYPKCRKKQGDLFLAACHFHQCLKASFPKFYLKDSLAQTCWMERGVT